MSERRTARQPAPYRKVHPFQFRLFCALVAAAIAAGLVVVLRTPARVTDGSGDHPVGLSPVMELIRQENEWVRDQKRDRGTDYVSIAVMLPLRSGQDRKSETAIKHALQGAYMAQYWSNHTEGTASAPNVQLLVADSSGTQDESQATVKELKELALGEEHLVAVTGLGSSDTRTKEVIDRLAAAKIAMVGALITSDELEGKATLVRVSPPNSAEARAIAHFLKARGPIRAVLVQDTNNETSYPSTLATSFTSAFADIVAPTRAGNRVIPPTLTYSSLLDNADTVLGQMPPQICEVDANVVFYAGRWENFAPFLRALAKRTCLTDRKITVVTGDDVSHLIDPLHPEQLWDGGRANLEVYYTALAHPGAWDAAPDAVQPVVTARFRQGKDSFTATFPKDSLDDGQAIMHHDAALTAIKIVDFFVSKGIRIPSTSAVANMLKSARLTVAGASGWISFDNRGNPAKKAIPIIRILAEGTAVFSTLTSEGGRPRTGPRSPVEASPGFGG